MTVHIQTASFFEIQVQRISALEERGLGRLVESNKTGRVQQTWLRIQVDLSPMVDGVGLIT